MDSTTDIPMIHEGAIDPTPGDGGNGAERTCLLVLGMHRSGTSALTRVLSLLGAALPTRMLGANASNEAGHWEPEALIAYNDGLLYQLGSSWHDWGRLDLTRLGPGRRELIKSDLQEIIDQDFGAARLMVVKEPRMCRFAQLVTEALADQGIGVAPILALRNPLEVISSLEARDGMSRANAALLWLRHVLDAEAATRGQPRAIASYDRLLSNWRGQIQAIASSLSLQFPYSSDDVAPTIDGFLTPELRHHARNVCDVALEPMLRGWVSQAYEAMCVLERAPSHPHAMAQLDEVRRGFDKASPGIRALLSGVTEKAAAQASEAKRQLSEITRQYNEQKSAVPKLTEALGQARTAAENAKTEAEAQAAELHRQLTALAAERDSKAAAVAELADALAQTRADAENTKAEAQARASEFAERSAVLASLEAELDEMRAEALAADQRAAGLANKLRDRDETLAERQAAIKALDDQIGRLQTDLSKSRQSIAQMSDELTVTAQSLDDARLQLEAERRVAGAQAGRYAAREAELIAKLNESWAQSAALQGELDAAQSRVGQLSRALSQAEESARDLSSRLEQHELKLKADADFLIQEQSRAHELDAAWAAERERATALDLELAARAQELQSARDEAHMSRTEVAQLHDMYRSSTSWRLAAPIRAAKTVPLSIGRFFRVIPAAVRVGGGMLPTTRKAVRLWRHGGIQALHDRIAVMENISRNVESAKEAAASARTPAVLAPGRLPSQNATIIFVTHDTHVGGAPTVLKALAGWFHRRTPFDVRIVSMREGALEHEFKASGMPFLTLFPANESPAGSRDATARLAAFAGENVCCVIINSVASAGFLDLWPRPHTKIISYVHELEQIIRLLGDNIEKIKQRSDLVVAGSHKVRDTLLAKFGFDPNGTTVIYDFVEEQSLNAPTNVEREEKRRELGLSSDARVVMACGTLHWRKWPEKFVEVAKLVVDRAPQTNWSFVWIGGGEDQEKCERLAEKLGVAGIVKFIGYRSDPSSDLRAADVFVLTSKEDPFPLVCLYAALSEAPIVCFIDAGGMPEFVSRGCGVSVPHGDASAMANAILGYSRDEQRRVAEGARGREIALANHTVANAGPAFLSAVRELCDVEPHVSVVVPNFNYAPFLHERLRSVYNQTFQDFEVILLDDCSSDDSVSILSDFAEERPSTRLIVNEANSGSPFAQWLKGMKEAKAELIWIAEADDYCEPDFLESVVNSMRDRNVFLGFSKSVPVDKSGAVLGDYEKLYLNRISDKRWSASYRVADHVEILEALGVANSIPNASSVVFRRFEPDDEFVDTVTSMKMCGDWYFYIRAIRGGLVSYVHRGLNFHRRHDSTVTHKTEGSQRYFDELRDTRRFIQRHYRVPPYTRERAKGFTQQDISRFGISDPVLAQTILDEAVYKNTAKDFPGLLVVASDLSPGGGQMFSVRLANAWVKKGGRAVLLNAEMYPTHDQVLAKLSPRVPLFSARSEDYSLARLVNDFGLDVIHSSIWWADRLVHDQIGDLPPEVPWITSMHGCYETLLEHPEVDPSFTRRFEGMKRRVSHWVYTAEKNKAVFEALGWPANTSKIPNGYEPEPVTELTRSRLGLRPDSLVVCLASRAIESKGWLEAIEAVGMLNQRGEKFDLMLIGEGPVADKLRASNLPPYVRLFGQVSDLQNYIAACDIGLLPSCFVGESMPLVIIEMMAQGKPVVATSVGEIPEMLVDDEGAIAGGLIDPANGRVRAIDVGNALSALADPLHRMDCGRRARSLYQQRFMMKTMLDRYNTLYRGPFPR